MNAKTPLLLRPLSSALLALALTTSLVRADWPQYRGPNLDGTSAEKISTKWPAAGLKPLWKVPTPNGFSSFAISGGKAFTMVGRDVGGAEQEVLVALDAATGKEVWAYALGVGSYGHGGGNEGAPDNKGGDGPRSTPSVDGNRVYAMSANLMLVCVDAASGKAVWTKDLVKEHGARNITWKNAASPLIDGNMVFVACGGVGQSLLGIDKATGKVVWKGQGDMITHSTPVAATIHNQRQIIFFTQSGLVSVNPASGFVLWRYAFPFKVSTAITPIVGGDIVYCAAGYGVGAGACKITSNGTSFTATEIWRKPGNQPVANHWSTPVYKDGFLYGMFQFKEYGSGPIKCVDIKTGDVKWEKPGFGPGNIILADGKIVALSDNGQLVVAEANPTAYKELARAKVLTGKCWSTPVLSEGKIFARSTTEAICVDVSAKSASR